MKTAYFDMSSGVSGDMILGALLDCGVPLEVVGDAVKALGLESVELKVARKSTHAITGVKFDVEYDREKHHAHRSLGSIRRMIEDSSLDPAVVRLAVKIFTRLGEAEASVHGVPLEEVHFHEVGAVDSIVDIVGAAAAVNHLGIERCFAGPFRVGTGFVEFSHGRIPVPVPATVLLIRGLPVERTAVEQEMTTPTGAAVVATLVPKENFSPTGTLSFDSVGYGLGSRELPDRPNLLRVMVGEQAGEHCPSTVVMECNIDDMNPQYYEYLMERLFAAGAHDVFFIPVQMKKNRPGVLLQVLTDRMNLEALSRLVLTETTSIGLRYHGVDRVTLSRREELVDTPWGEFRVKVVVLPDGTSRARAEFDDLRRAAESTGIPLPEMARRLDAFLDKR
ncbi:MAG: nickel pincer cofactor biosynthesis protein LarC [Candidatus Glassbacteria bacterium]|nr:nickel pincer cofactor biosynthesis protein LarC [Candidatus Glassbacteria bacterium]